MRRCRIIGVFLSPYGIYKLAAAYARSGRITGFAGFARPYQPSLLIDRCLVYQTKWYLGAWSTGSENAQDSSLVESRKWNGFLSLNSDLGFMRASRPKGQRPPVLDGHGLWLRSDRLAGAMADSPRFVSHGILDPALDHPRNTSHQRDKPTMRRLLSRMGCLLRSTKKS
jgi:hypothetical protein